MRPLVFGTYKVNEGHVEAQIAETIADVPQRNLRPLSYVGQRAVTADRGAAGRARPHRPNAVVVVEVRLAVQSFAAAASLQLAGGGVLTRRKVPATDGARHEHLSRRTTVRDAPVEVLQQPRVDRVEQKTS